MSRVVIPNPKPPADDRVYTLDYSRDLQGAAIAASTWDIPDGVVKVADSFDGTTTTIEISGGEDGGDYLLTNAVTDSNGIAYSAAVAVRVRLPGAVAAAIATRYATVADMVARFGERAIVELTDTGDEPTGFISQAVATRALADADATIDGYLQARYELPLASVPPLLNLYACDIARYRLMGERSIEEVRQRYEDAIAYLRRVANGELGIGVDDAGEAPVESATRVAIQADRRTFSREKLRDYTHPPSILGGIP